MTPRMQTGSHAHETPRDTSIHLHIQYTAPTRTDLEGSIPMTHKSDENLELGIIGRQSSYSRPKRSRHWSKSALSPSNSRPHNTSCSLAAKLLRDDSVHRDDHDDLKGLYHINQVSKATRFHSVGSLERISECCLLPSIEASIRRLNKAHSSPLRTRKGRESQ